MQSAAEIVWLIPLLPLLGAIASGFGLIGFNRAMNQLKKPVASTLMTCVGISAVLSYAVLFEQIVDPHSVEHLFVWASAGILIFQWAMWSIH